MLVGSEDAVREAMEMADCGLFFYEAGEERQ
jgi:hypothetical protein